jgi:hypothetical protein
MSIERSLLEGFSFSSIVRVVIYLQLFFVEGIKMPGEMAARGRHEIFYARAGHLMVPGNWWF